MSKITSFIKIPNYLDVILLVLLASRLVLGTAIESKFYSSDFGFFAKSYINPLSFFGEDFTDGTPISIFWRLSYVLQGTFFVVVLVLVLAGLKKLAAIVAILATLLSSVLPPLVSAIEMSMSKSWNLFEEFGWQYRLNGEVFEPVSEEFIFDGGMYVMKQLHLGVGLLLILAFFTFYLIRQFPRKIKENVTEIQVEKKGVMTAKADFCAKCGAEAAAGDFCTKCGSSLLVMAGSVGQSSSYSASRTSPLAIAAIISVFFVSWVGIVLGYLARKEIRSSGGQLSGEGMAKAAIIIGWVASGLAILIGIIWAVAIGIAAGNAYSY